MNDQRTRLVEHAGSAIADWIYYGISIVAKQTASRGISWIVSRFSASTSAS
jgi:hypothetical protein